MHAFPATYAVAPLTRPPRLTVAVPGSKSITNRALVLAALASRDRPGTLAGVLRSEDTEVMIDGLTKLGYRFAVDWTAETVRFDVHGSPRLVPNDAADLFVANSGTTVRFLAAMVSLSPGNYRFDGVPRMRERPIGDLLDALQAIGIAATSDAGTGCPPIAIRSPGWPDRPLVIPVRAGVSSQFLSALMLAAPWHPHPVSFDIQGDIVSEPYLEMSRRMVETWAGQPATYAIEPDASSASYFFAAAAIAGGQVTVHGTHRGMLQGDIAFVDALERMGCRVEECDEGITVHGRPLTGIDIDMNAISDTVMTLAAVACFATGPTTIRNVPHIRHKETDRIAAVATELRKVGIAVDERPDGLTIHPGPMYGATLATYRDHRMAMSLALLGLKTPGIVIDDPGCVAKTFPEFWTTFEMLRETGAQAPSIRRLR
jgi:3-phosphoshikimate 1-carboxyvinyltransferase